MLTVLNQDNHIYLFQRFLYFNINEAFPSSFQSPVVVERRETSHGKIDNLGNREMIDILTSNIYYEYNARQFLFVRRRLQKSILAT